MDLYSNNKLRSIELFINLISINERVITFQYKLNKKTANLINQYGDTFSIKTQKQITIAHASFTRNMQYLFVSHESLCCGLSSPAHDLFRTVHESILMQYYVALYRENFDKLLNESRPLNKNRKYSHNFYKQKLYEGETEKQVGNFYQLISISSHANPYDILDITYEKSILEHNFKYLIYLSFFNVLSYVENFSLIPDILMEILDYVQEFVDETLKDLDNNLIPLFPNKRDLHKKCIFHPPHQK